MIERPLQSGRNAGLRRVFFALSAFLPFAVAVLVGTGASPLALPALDTGDVCFP